MTVCVMGGHVPMVTVLTLTRDVMVSVTVVMGQMRTSVQVVTRDSSGATEMVSVLRVAKFVTRTWTVGMAVMRKIVHTETTIIFAGLKGNSFDHL